METELQVQVAFYKEWLSLQEGTVKKGSFEILQSIFILSFNWLNLKLWRDDQDKPTLCNWEKKFMEVGKLIGCIQMLMTMEKFLSHYGLGVCRQV